MDQYPEILSQLPKLPGYVHDFSVKPNQRKSHAFDISNETKFMRATPGIGILDTAAI